jgi:hypothetical protein
VPEAAIHEDCDFLFWKDKVGLAKKRTVAAPSGDVVLTEDFDEGLSVAVSITEMVTVLLLLSACLVGFGFYEQSHDSFSQGHSPPADYCIPQQ